MHFINGNLEQNLKYAWEQWNEPLIEIEPNEEIKISIPDSSSSQITDDWDSAMLKTIDNSKVDALVGPIKISGLKNGDTVKIEILDIKPGRLGWSAIMSNFGLLKNHFNDRLVLWDINKDYAVAKNNFLRGLRIPLNPMLGIIGTSPSFGRYPVIPPQSFGGNLDNKYNRKGASIHLPVYRDGAYLALSDPHASQGNGEVCGTGIETSAEVTIRVSKSIIKSKYPIIESSHSFNDRIFVFTGIDTDLYKAAQKAVQSFIDYSRSFGLEDEESYILASVACDLEISEIVDEPNLEVSLTVPGYIIDYFV